MAMHRRPCFVLVLCLLALTACSCSKSGKKTEGAPADTAGTDSTLSYISEEVSFGVFFDEEGVQRTVKLGGRGGETTAYLFVHFPEAMQIAAVEYRLVLPPGVKILSDVGYNQRVALLGTLEGGISETFPCVGGPKIMLHVLKLSVPQGLENGEISLLSHEQSQFIGIAMCDEGRTMVAATSFKAVINPTE